MSTEAWEAIQNAIDYVENQLPVEPKLYISPQLQARIERGLASGEFTIEEVQAALLGVFR